jgi:hypothetical protein
MFVGIGVGIGRQRYASGSSGIFSAYASRVAADGGVTEAGACVDAVSTLLQTASLLLVPSGYKSGKAYSQIPTNGNGDLTWTRASTANRTNGSGDIELMGTGVPRLSYMYGSCPALLLEPQRTNSIRNSTMVGASTSPSTLPTNWVRQNTSGLTQSVVGLGTENGINYIDINLQGTATGANDAYSFDQTISASIGQTWTNSWYFKLVSSNPNAVRLAMQEFNGGAFLNVVTQDITPTTTLARYSQTKTLVGTGVTNVRAMIYVNFVIGQTYDTTIRLAAPQMELGAYSTTYIPTTTASATRVADSFSRNNIYTNGLITSSGGTWFVELRGNLALNAVGSGDDIGAGLELGDSGGSSINAFKFRQGGGAQRLAIWKVVSSTSTLLYAMTTDTAKVAIKWNGSTMDIFVNGTKVVSATSFTATNMEFLRYVLNQRPTFIQQMALYPTPLSDTDCTILTTL